MAGHSRPKEPGALLAYVPAIPIHLHNIAALSGITTEVGLARLPHN
jgi:hypothetical protein